MAVAFLARHRDLAQNVCVGAALCTAGDLAAQKVAATDDGVDARRLGAMTSYGAWSAVPYHFWYKFLAARPINFLQKTFLECFVVTPGFEIPAITTWTGVMGRQQTWAEAGDQLRRDFPAMFITGLAVWGPSSLVMFRFIPAKWHVTTVYSVGAVWDCCISYLAFDAKPVCK